MQTPHAPFALTFDSIELDPTRAPPREAIEHAMALAAPRDADAPGFYLLNDSDGRFVVDRDMGVVSLANEAVLTRDAGAVHSVRMRVVEPSGAAYELDLMLRVTGLVPQMVGAEDLDLCAPAPTLGPAPHCAWSRYAAAAGSIGVRPLGDEHSSFGALIEPPAPPSAPGPYRLHLFTPLPRPSGKNAPWSL